MILELIIKAIESAMADKSKARDQRVLDDLRRLNDAAARAGATGWAPVAAPAARGKRQGRERGRPAPPPVPVARPVVPPVAAAGPNRTAAPAAATARAISRWARPQTLRSQFILSEVLKPPLSMREPREP